jgi:hypothetical protein
MSTLDSTGGIAAPIDEFAPLSIVIGVLSIVVPFAFTSNVKVVPLVCGIDNEALIDIILNDIGAINLVKSVATAIGVTSSDAAIPNIDLDLLNDDGKADAGKQLRPLFNANLNAGIWQNIYNYLFFFFFSFLA